MSVIEIAVAIVVGGILLLLGLEALDVLRKWRASHQTPGTQALTGALMQYAYKAIFAGESLAVIGLQEFDTELSGVDKKAVADSIYDLLPDSLVIGAIPVPIQIVKSIITREKFEELVENVYLETHSFLLRNETYLQSQVEMLEPPPANPAGG